MLHRKKIKLFTFILLCMIAGSATQGYAQDANNTQATTKAQIPAALIAKWTQEATDGNADAQFLLGNAYYNGNGVPQDYNQAISWWHKSAAQGNASAQRALDQMVPK